MKTMRKGIRKKSIELFELCFGDGTNTRYKNFEEGFNVEFVELSDNESFEEKELKITAYELEHGDCKPILGFTIEKEGKTIGYATDTTICDGVKRICTNSDIAFIDATNIIPTRSHMGLNETVCLKTEFPNCKIYAIHRSDYVHNNINEIEFPEDGDIIEI